MATELMSAKRNLVRAACATRAPEPEQPPAAEAAPVAVEPPPSQPSQPAAAPPGSGVTVTDVLPQLLAEMEAPANRQLRQRDPQAFRAKFDEDDRWQQLRMGCPRLYLKAVRGELSMSDPQLQRMLGHISAIREGTKTLKQAWKEVDKEMTETYVYPSIGRPDQFGRPTGPSTE